MTLRAPPSKPASIVGSPEESDCIPPDWLGEGGRKSWPYGELGLLPLQVFAEGVQP